MRQACVSLLRGRYQRAWKALNAALSMSSASILVQRKQKVVEQG